MKTKHYIAIALIGTVLTYFNFISGIDLPSILRWAAQKYDSLSRSDESLSSKYVQRAGRPGDAAETGQTEAASKATRKAQVELNSLRRQKLNYFNKEYQRAIELIRQGRFGEADRLSLKLKQEIQEAKDKGFYQ